MSSLYDRMGGEAALLAAVGGFYQRVLEDPQLAPLFAGIDVGSLHRHQHQFLSLAMGGPNAYAGDDLRAAHRHVVARFGIGDDEFDRVLHHLDAALAALGVVDALRAEVIALADSVREDVLGRARRQPAST
ncbi:MAG: group I truncated hemoglobin [Pseudomarimonas sp.]